MNREEITEKLIQMMTAESEWVKTGIELEEVHNGIRRVAEGVAPHVVRLLADERERLQGKLQDYQSDPEYDNRYLQGQDDMQKLIRNEREKVREMCAVATEEIEDGDDSWNCALGRASVEIRQLALTKDLAASSTEEGKGGDAK